MKENIFYSTDYDAIVYRIESLNEQSIRQWGTMSLPQMLEHCAIQLKLALGHLPVQKKESIFLYRTRLGRWLSLYVIPWPKGFETPSIMNMKSNGIIPDTFDEEKAQLLRLLSDVSQRSLLLPHPFYGAIRKKDWGRLIWVHLDHHLRQFGH